MSQFGFDKGTLSIKFVKANLKEGSGGIFGLQNMSSYVNLKFDDKSY